MFWRLMHEDLNVTDDNKIISRSFIVFEHENVKVKFADTLIPEEHVLGSKKVLMDSAYKLEDIARQMKKKAEDMK